jgi:hypothetical protein
VGSWFPLPNQLDRPVAVAAPDETVSPPAGTHSSEEPRCIERRTEARYPAQEAAELEIMFDCRPIYGTILDVSRSGLRIELPQRINRGEQVKVKLNRNVIFGEVRYCRAVSDAFHAGIRIHDLVRPASSRNQHLSEDALSFYAVGKGLSVSEVIEVREHLLGCERCRTRVAEREALLNPSPRTGPTRTRPLK